MICNSKICILSHIIHWNRTQADNILSAAEEKWKENKHVRKSLEACGYRNRASVKSAEKTSKTNITISNTEEKGEAKIL